MALAVALAATGVLAADSRKTGSAPKLSIRWLGHSCFLVTTRAGTRVLLDPVGLQGYPVDDTVVPDLVLVSHRHDDHDALDRFRIQPGCTVLHGVTEDGTAWVPHARTFRDVGVRSVGTFHDRKRGADLGLTAAFRLDVDGITIVHLGDLGHMLTPAQIASLSPVDVLLVPVGGRVTLSAREAEEVVAQLRPRIATIAMHGRTEEEPRYPNGADDFAEGRPALLRPGGDTFAFDPQGVRPKEPLTVILALP